MKFERATEYGRYAADLDLLESMYSRSCNVHPKLFENTVFLILSFMCSLYLFRWSFC